MEIKGFLELSSLELQVNGGYQAEHLPAGGTPSGFDLLDVFAPIIEEIIKGLFGN